jgi:hypothetical protein
VNITRAEAQQSYPLLVCLPSLPLLFAIQEDFALLAAPLAAPLVPFICQKSHLLSNVMPQLWLPVPYCPTLFVEAQGQVIDEASSFIDPPGAVFLPALL